MNANQLFQEFEKGFPKRKFSAGLLIAFIDFLKDLKVPGRNFKSLNEMLSKYPRQQTTAAGHHANTLIVARGGQAGTVSLRPFYNEAERFFRAEKKRFDYPSCAPHATQAWGDYHRWLDVLVTFTRKELDGLRAEVVDYVLTQLKSQEFDPGSVQTDPPLFRIVLESFSITSQKGEPTAPGTRASSSVSFAPAIRTCKLRSTKYAPDRSACSALAISTVGKAHASPFRLRSSN